MAHPHWLEEPLEPDDSILAARARVLELLAQDEKLTVVLEQLCRDIEEQEPGILASVLLVSEDGSSLVHGAGPSLPSAYLEAIDGIAIGDGIGSCGTAAATKRPTIAKDVQSDPNWADFKDLAAEHGLASCYSTPVVNDNGKVVATFAIYRREPSEPSLRERQLAHWFQHLVDVAIRLDAA